MDRIRWFYNFSYIYNNPVIWNVLGCLKMFLEKVELSWHDDDEKYVRYEEDLKKWELNKTHIRETEEERELSENDVREENKKD